MNSEGMRYKRYIFSVHTEYTIFGSNIEGQSHFTPSKRNISPFPIVLSVNYSFSNVLANHNLTLRLSLGLKCLRTKGYIWYYDKWWAIYVHTRGIRGIFRSHSGESTIRARSLNIRNRGSCACATSWYPVRAGVKSGKVRIQSWILSNNWNRNCEYSNIIPLCYFETRYNCSSTKAFFSHRNDVEWVE